MEAVLFKSEPKSIPKMQYKEINKKVKGLTLKGIDPTSLTKLESILTGEDFFEIYQRGDYSVIHRIDDNGPWFISSSENLMNSLRNVTDHEKTDIIDQWCNSQEMSLYGWTKSKAQYLLNWLIETAETEINPTEQIILFLDKTKTEKRELNLQPH